MIVLTPNAKDHLQNLVKEHGKKYVRLQVHGGGCAGFEYGWSFEDEKEEEDIVVEDLVVIDDINESYIKGLEVDYKKEIFGSNFEFNNPMSSSQCGCGTSFSV
jgi:iron-sulfur cluster assembly protein|tara:strand:- start:106 stop:414 length:309 start_codon:yes stop_codon:yes gene_type:complete